MGCGSSTIAPEEEVVQTTQVSQNKEIHNDHNKANGHAKTLPPPNDVRKNSHENVKKQNSSVDKNANKLNAADQTPVPKSIAFDVSFDGEEHSLLKKRKPARLLTLEPLNVTTFTAEQLEEKQRLADEKRERIRQKKINRSQKSSRLRKELVKAREFEQRQQMEQEKSHLDDHIRQADIKREQRLLEIQEKQKIREERAKRARERAKKMQNPDDEVEVEKDDQFNAPSDESWLDNSEHMEREEEGGPQKRVSRQSNLRPTASASTVDSYDAAFTRTNTHERVVFDEAALGDDDFFGS